MTSKKLLFPLVSLIAASSAAQAQEETIGMAKPWQLGFQPPASPVMERIEWLHNGLLLGVCVGITLFVLALVAYICLRFNRRANPVPSKVAHNTPLEIIWTVLPILILVAIAIPSWRLHYYMERNPDYEMTIKAVGHQWYWSYEYPDQGNFGFDSYMVKDADLKPGQPRLLAVDNELVVPVDTAVRMQLTGADVIHSWAVPAFGVKRDAMPGRLNETWFKAEKLGVFYGQCSELCGVGHGFMPIAVRVVPKDQFAAWVAGKQKEAGIVPPQNEVKQEPAHAKDLPEGAKTQPVENTAPGDKASDQQVAPGSSEKTKE